MDGLFLVSAAFFFGFGSFLGYEWGSHRGWQDGYSAGYDAARAGSQKGKRA